jgi:hypothetical protein
MLPRPEFRWKVDGDRLANGFFGLKTKELRSAPVPSGDDSVQVFANDGIVGGLQTGNAH